MLGRHGVGGMHHGIDGHRQGRGQPVQEQAGPQHGTCRDQVDNGVAAAGLDHGTGHVVGLDFGDHVELQVLCVQRLVQHNAGRVAGLKCDERLAGDFGQGNRVLPHTARHQHQFGLAERNAFDARTICGVVGDDQIQFPGLQACNQFAGVMGVQVECDAGLPFVYPPDHGGQQPQTDCRRAADPQMALLQMLQVVRKRAQADQFLFQAGNLRGQDVGFAGGVQPALDAFKQFVAQAYFSVGQQFAGGRLGNVQGFGRFGERSGTQNGVNQFDMVQTHARYFSLIQIKAITKG